jgi:hypothetical protein
MNLTIGQLKKACTGTGYILVTLPSGRQVGVNKKMALIAQKRNGKKYDSKLSGLIGWRECSLNEYINKKAPYKI